MSRYQNLLNKLNTGSKINLLFVSPDYGDLYPFSYVETGYFDKKKFNCDVILITNKDIPAVIEMACEYDCVINLCDGYVGNMDNIPETNFIDALETHGIPYTGCSKNVYTLSKNDLQKCNTDDIICVPKCIHYKDLENISCLQFPLFVKPNNLGCSELVDNNSVVNNVKELNIQLEKVVNFTDKINK